MIIRRATLADIQKLLPLFHAYRNFYKQQIDPQNAVKFLTEGVSDHKAVIFIVIDEKHDSNIIGFAQLIPARCSLRLKNYWILYDLYIDTNYRNMHLAEALLDEVEKFAIESGAARIELQTAYNNLPAQKLYEKKGYQQEQEFRSYVRVLPVLGQNPITILTATPFQEQIWRDQQLVPDNLKYNLVYLFHLSGNVHLDALDYAWQQLVRSHPALRTRFEKKQNEILQIINDNYPTFLEIIDADELDKAQLDKIMQQKARHRFHLDKFPLCFANILKCQNNDFYLLFNFHHIIIDGYSIDLLLRQFASFYQQYCNGTNVSVTTSISTLKDYLNHSQQHLSEIRGKARAFWQQQLKDAPRRITFLHEGADNNTSVDPRISFELPVQIVEFANSKKISVFVVMSALFAFTLYSYSLQQDMVIGYPSNRRLDKFHSLVGYIVNQLPLPLHVTDQTTFAQLCESIKQHRSAVSKNAFDDLPLLEIAKSLGISASNNMVLFNIMISPTSFGNLSLSGVQTKAVPVDISASLCDMLLLYQPDRTCISCVIQYKSSVFNQQLIEKFIRDLKELAHYCLHNLEFTIAQHPILANKVYSRL